MAPKKQRLSLGGSSSSAPQWDRTKFVSEEAFARYNQTFAKKSLVPERGLRPDDKMDGQLMAMILQRKWVHFTKQPGSANFNLVREFYANANDEGPAVVQVRGQAVAYDRVALNAVFDMPSYFLETGERNDYLKNGISSYDLDDIIRRLCKPGTAWKTNESTGEKTSFPQSGLSCYGKAWYSFICSSIMPTRHVSDVTKDRAVLLFAIVTGLDIDIGACIHESILKAVKGTTTGGLPHPSLITRLCRRAKVQWREDEVMQGPMSVIDHAAILRYDVWDGADPQPRGEGYLPSTQPPPPFSEAETSAQPPNLGSSSQGPLTEILASLSLLHQNQNVIAQRQARHTAAIAQRQAIMMQYQSELANTMRDIYTSFGGDDADVTPFQFPEPPVFPPYPPPSPTAEEGNEVGNEEGDGDTPDDDGTD